LKEATRISFVSLKKTLLEINQRIILFYNIPFDKLDRRALELKVKEIGEAEL
jgi:hypothetical protein